MSGLLTCGTDPPIGGHAYANYGSFISIRLLHTLIAVAESGCIVAAPGQVNVSHAAIGQQMRRLEARLGATLFDRNAKPPKLAALARSLFHKERDLLAPMIAYRQILAAWPPWHTKPSRFALQLARSGPTMPLKRLV